MRRRVYTYIYKERGRHRSGPPRRVSSGFRRRRSSTTQSSMDAAISTLVAEFKAHAGKDGSASTLSMDELQNLVASQLSNYVPNAKDPVAIGQLMSSLDDNNDGELTFAEFWQLIGKLAAKQADL